MRLTEKDCDQLIRSKNGLAQSMLADGDGLYIALRASGTKAWLVKYKCPDTFRQTSVVFASYPDTTLTQARYASRRINRILNKGLNPKHYKELFFEGDISAINLPQESTLTHDLLYTGKYFVRAINS